MWGSAEVYEKHDLVCVGRIKSRLRHEDETNGRMFYGIWKSVNRFVIG